MAYGPGHDSNGGEFGTAVGEWLCTRAWPVVWAVTWRLTLWTVGWFIAGILIKAGFMAFDWLAMYYMYLR